MKNISAIALCAAALPLLVISCAQTLAPTAEVQKTLTPDGVLQELMAGNQRFTAGKQTNTNIATRIAQTSSGQFPKAYILSCVDSRVPVEQVFDQGIGDIFVGRVAGNVESVEQLGSMEFASAAAGVKLVMVLGHEACGAVKGACDHVKMGNLTTLLGEITPAVNSVKGFAAKDRTSENKEFVAAVVEENVRRTVSDLRKRSSVLAGLEKEGKIKIVGGLYSLHTGEVTLLD